MLPQSITLQIPDTGNHHFVPKIQFAPSEDGGFEDQMSQLNRSHIIKEVANEDRSPTNRNRSPERVPGQQDRGVPGPPAVDKPPPLPKVPLINVDQSTNGFINNYKKRVVPPRLRPQMTILNVMKLISQIYIERFRGIKNQPNQPLVLQAYLHFLQRFGLRRVAENKLTQFLDSCKDYAGRSRRVRLFCRFLQIVEPGYETDDLNLYLECLRLFDDSQGGMGFIASLHETVPINSLKAAEALFSKFTQKLSQLEIKYIYQEISNINQDYIDLDYLLEMILKIATQKRGEVKSIVKKVFLGTDLDGDELIEHDEFLLLFRHIEPARFREDYIKKIFVDHCDLASKDGTKYLSLTQFATLCMKENVFSEKKIKDFTYVVHENSVKTWEDLAGDWPRSKGLIKGRAVATGHYEGFLKGGVGKISEFISKKLETATSEMKESIWMTYKLLEAETRRLYMELHLKEYLSPEMQMIQAISPK